MGNLACTLSYPSCALHMGILHDLNLTSGWKSQTTRYQETAPIGGITSETPLRLEFRDLCLITKKPTIISISIVAKDHTALLTISGNFSKKRPKRPPVPQLRNEIFDVNSLNDILGYHTSNSYVVYGRYSFLTIQCNYENNTLVTGKIGKKKYFPHFTRQLRL